MPQSGQESRVATVLPVVVIAVGVVLLGVGGWFLFRDSEPNTEPPATATPSTTTSSVLEETPEEETGEVAASPSVTTTGATGTETEGGGLGEIARGSEGLPQILVRGETPQGWAIESPDGYGFYPVGPAGPQVFSETVSTGFAQSPEGAGFAAIHILQRLNPLNPEWKVAAESQLVGAGAAPYMAGGEEMLATSDVPIEVIREAAALKNAWVGWSVLGFDPQAADLRLAGIGSSDNGGEFRYTLDVRLEWLDGDWRVVSSDPDGLDLVAFVAAPEDSDVDVDMREAFAL